MPPFWTAKLAPAFMLFEILERGRWVGNLYAVVLKDKEGHAALLLDGFQLRDVHPVLNLGDAPFEQFMRAFMDRFKRYLESQGFQALLIAPQPSSRTKLINALTRIGQKEGVKVSADFTKPGGNHQLRMLKMFPDYVQSIPASGRRKVHFEGQQINLNGQPPSEQKEENSSGPKARVVPLGEK
jgi:hypothetical protein